MAILLMLVCGCPQIFEPRLPESFCFTLNTTDAFVSCVDDVGVVPDDERIRELYVRYDGIIGEAEDMMPIVSELENLSGEWDLAQTYGEKQATYLSYNEKVQEYDARLESLDDKSAKYWKFVIQNRAYLSSHGYNTAEPPSISGLALMRGYTYGLFLISMEKELEEMANASQS